MATTAAPSSCRNFARNEPTLPNPCTATFMPASRRSCFATASRMQKRLPRAVASSRPSDPPTLSGLPVTTPSTEWPLFIEYVSKIHAITDGSVPTSGAGMSFSGPISLMISLVNRRVIRWSSERESFFGSTALPPFAPQDRLKSRRKWWPKYRPSPDRELHRPDRRAAPVRRHRGQSQRVVAGREQVPLRVAACEPEGVAARQQVAHPHEQSE